MMVARMTDPQKTDWKLIAKAVGLELSEDELSRTVAPLESLEPAFQQARAGISPDTDLAVVFHPAPERSAT